MIINSHNDWDPLEEVIVGHAHHFYVNTDISSHSFSFADRRREDIEHMAGPMPQWLIDEANEDIDAFADVLTKFGVRVHRPAIVDWSQEFATLDWRSHGWQSWCPRDLIINLGDMLIETPSPVRSRYFETQIYHDILYEAFDDGALWLAAPRPRLLDSIYDIEGDTKGRSTLLDHEICFDAPKIVRR